MQTGLYADESIGFVGYAVHSNTMKAIQSTFVYMQSLVSDQQITRPISNALWHALYDVLFSDAISSIRTVCCFQVLSFIHLSIYTKHEPIEYCLVTITKQIPI